MSSAREAINAIINVLHDPEVDLTDADEDHLHETIGLLGDYE